MARGFCVDCNYEGALNPMGDCPRCGSQWTTGPDELMDEELLEGLDSMNVGGTKTDVTATGEFALFI